MPQKLEDFDTSLYCCDKSLMMPMSVNVSPFSLNKILNLKMYEVKRLAKSSALLCPMHITRRDTTR